MGDRQKGDLISILFSFWEGKQAKKQTVHVSFPQSMTKNHKSSNTSIWGRQNKSRLHSRRK